MEILESIPDLLIPILIFFLSLSLLAIRMLMDKTNRIEEEFRKFQLLVNDRSLKRAAAMVKHCNAPIEILLDELKDQSQTYSYLSSVPQDDLIAKILDKYTRS